VAFLNHLADVESVAAGKQNQVLNSQGVTATAGMDEKTDMIMGRAFSPNNKYWRMDTYGDAIGWDRAAPLVLEMARKACRQPEISTRDREKRCGTGLFSSARAALF